MKADKPNQLELNFEPIGVTAERIVTQLAARPCRATKAKSPLANRDVNQGHAAHREANENEPEVGGHLPVPRLMQIALSAIMKKDGIVSDRGRRKRYVSKLQDGKAWRERRELPPANAKWPTCLIIAPSTVVHNWEREFETVCIYHFMMIKH